MIGLSTTMHDCTAGAIPQYTKPTDKNTTLAKRDINAAPVQSEAKSSPLLASVLTHTRACFEALGNASFLHSGNLPIS